MSTPPIDLKHPELPSGSVVLAVLHRDLIGSWRQLGDVLTPLFFFLMVASLFPLAVGPEVALLRRIGPGIVWVAALLSIILALPRLFLQDYQEGVLEQMMLSPTALWVMVHAKVWGLVVTTGLPLVAISPLLAMQFGLDSTALVVLALSLLMGMPIMVYLGAVGAALTLGLRGGGVLVAVLILPLFVPVLVFGVGAVDAVAAGTSSSAHFSILAALMLVTSFFGPFAIQAALTISTE